ncbi:hypothetical protein [Paenibacillus sp. GCM10027626]|uniref:hypothetical protein n=1 Tax=Paenibacillus sp. GCM10027626 TaxID=3273411 RepID=UPI003633A2CB
MTNQEIKLNEARYQFSEMVKWSNERKITELQYAMSAFASAARSVIQYTFESAKLLGVVHTVYEELVSDKPMIKFFKDLRDVNIHTRPERVGTAMNNSLAAVVIVRTSETTEDELVEYRRRAEEHKDISNCYLSC